MHKYALGLDFGTESLRVVLMDLDTGEQFTTKSRYRWGVMDEYLKDKVQLPEDWALQDAEDYLQAMGEAIPQVLKFADITSDSVVSIGIAFTACTVVPAKRDGTPISSLSGFTYEPHAYVKLWKHHGAKEETRIINEIARARNEPFLPYYSGQISVEWMLPKVFELLRNAPHIYEITDIFFDAGDWIVYQLTGKRTRSTCNAGYKGLWVAELGFPQPEFLEALDPRLRNLYETKQITEVNPPGTLAGFLTHRGADITGLKPGTPVAVSMIDAHAGAIGMGISQPGIMGIIMGTSSCHMVLNDKPVIFDGYAGMVKDGILPGYWGYESGQSATGDILAWFVSRFVKCDNPYTTMERLAMELKPGESHLIALDWWHGNRSVLMDAELTGLIVGLTLNTKPHDIYRALVESTAYGTRVIAEVHENAGIMIDEIRVCGGLTKSELLVKIYADVLNKPIKVYKGEPVATGALICGLVAAGKEWTGFDTFDKAIQAIVGAPDTIVIPDERAVKVYDKLYSMYRELYKMFGTQYDIMHGLRQIEVSS